jgi:general secretion pathway protein G
LRPIAPVTTRLIERLREMKRSSRNGFSLIEMVIVILILGIIAAVAAPKMFDTASTAEENSTRQQLGVLRNAIEMYRARAGVYPANGELPNAMVSMLSGPFPAPTMGAIRGNDGVYYDTNADVTTLVVPDEGQDAGWAYKPANGSLKLNVGAGDTGADW